MADHLKRARYRQSPRARSSGGGQQAPVAKLAHARGSSSRALTGLQVRTLPGVPNKHQEARMAHLDLTDTDGRHHRFNNPEVRILRKAARHITEDGAQVVYDGTWILEVTTKPDSEGIHQTEWVDGAEPLDFNHAHV